MQSLEFEFTKLPIILFLHVWYTQMKLGESPEYLEYRSQNM